MASTNNNTANTAEETEEAEDAGETEVTNEMAASNSESAHVFVYGS